MRNSEIADAFAELGDLYELDGAIVHRVLAYRNAAKAIRDSPVSVEEKSKAGTVTELAGVGKTIEEKIVALLETGSIPAADKLKAKYPVGLVEVMRVPGLGAKKVRKLYDELGVSSIAELKQAAEAHQLRGLAGFGVKAEENILAGLSSFEADGPRTRVVLSRALAVAIELRDALREHPAAGRVEIAGSARRLADSCKDLDLVATATDPIALSKAFAAMPLIEDAGRAGRGRSPRQHEQRA